MDWVTILGKNIDYPNSIITPYIFCPFDYKNVNDWKQKMIPLIENLISNLK